MPAIFHIVFVLIVSGAIAFTGGYMAPNVHHGSTAITAPEGMMMLGAFLVGVGIFAAIDHIADRVSGHFDYG
ncbi:hypothetical protein K8R03_02885 [Candidatus Kaiserbacteria bacterium]|nr:hypothetical protein [Candidatus Kaiserbacteria bacterium]